MKGERVLHDYSVLLGCKFGDIGLSKGCRLFSNMFTANGIGYTFNNKPFWNLFKNTSSNFAFFKEMYERRYSIENALPRLTESNGQTFSLDFGIRHEPYGYKFIADDELFVKSQTVYLSLHDPSAMPNMKSEGITLQPGQFYEIRVYPTLTVTEESGLGLDHTARNCISKDDNVELKAFSQYSQTACLFECKLQKAIQVCNCSAWDYPRIDPSAKLCKLQDRSSQCFNYMMDSTIKSEEDCDCMNDCEHIQYTMDLQVTPLTGTSDNSRLG